MAAEVREAELKANASSDSDSSTQPGFWETNEAPGSSGNTLLVASDSVEDLNYVGLTNGKLPSVSTSGTIHTIQKKVRRASEDEEDNDSENTDQYNESANALDKEDSVITEDSQENVEVSPEEEESAHF